MSEPVVACQQNSDLGNLESLMHRAWWSLEAWPFLHALNTFDVTIQSCGLFGLKLTGQCSGGAKTMRIPQLLSQPRSLM